MALQAERSGASLHEKNLENRFAFLEFFKCLSIIVRLPELRGGRRLPRVVGDADLYRLYGNTA